MDHSSWRSDTAHSDVQNDDVEGDAFTLHAARTRHGSDSYDASADISCASSRAGRASAEDSAMQFQGREAISVKCVQVELRTGSDGVLVGEDASVRHHFAGQHEARLAQRFGRIPAQKSEKSSAQKVGKFRADRFTTVRPSLARAATPTTSAPSVSPRVLSHLGGFIATNSDGSYNGTTDRSPSGAFKSGHTVPPSSSHNTRQPSSVRGTGIPTSQSRHRSTSSLRRSSSSSRRGRGRGSRGSLARGVGARLASREAGVEGGVAAVGAEAQMARVGLGFGAWRAVALMVSASLVIWSGRSVAGMVAATKSNFFPLCSSEDESADDAVLQAVAQVVTNIWRW